jgi:hypothetical protein
VDGYNAPAVAILAEFDGGMPIGHLAKVLHNFISSYVSKPFAFRLVEHTV